MPVPVVEPVVVVDVVLVVLVPVVLMPLVLRVVVDVVALVDVPDPRDEDEVSCTRSKSTNDLR